MYKVFKISQPLFLLGLFWAFFSFSGSCQSSFLSVYGPNPNKDFSIDRTERIFVRMANEEKEVRGRLEEVKVNSIVVNGRELPLDQIVGIGKGSHIAALARGASIAVVGLIWTTFGYGFFVQGAVENDPLFLGGGTLDIAIGSTITYVGAVPYIQRTKRYYRGQGYYFKLFP